MKRGFQGILGILTEKYANARADQENLVNKRTETISKCRHRHKNFI